VIDLCLEFALVDTAILLDHRQQRTGHTYRFRNTPQDGMYAVRFGQHRDFLYAALTPPMATIAPIESQRSRGII
jgi:hypothetical protein